MKANLGDRVVVQFSNGYSELSGTVIAIYQESHFPLWVAFDEELPYFTKFSMQTLNDFRENKKVIYAKNISEFFGKRYTLVAYNEIVEIEKGYLYED